MHYADMVTISHHSLVDVLDQSICDKDGHLLLLSLFFPVCQFSLLQEELFDERELY